LGMDPFELRWKNAADEGTLRPNNVPWPKIGLKQCLADVEGRYKELLAKKAEADPNSTVKQGVGIALGGWPGGLEPSTAICRLNGDGTGRVVLGSVGLTGTDDDCKYISA